MIDSVFYITGHKVSSLMVDDNSVKLMTKEPITVHEFRAAWDKKVSINTKVEIKFEKITAIKKEDNDDTVVIRYKNFMNLTINCEFSFNSREDCEVFLTHFVKNLFYQKTYERMNRINANRNYILGLVFSLVFITMSYFEAMAQANGTSDEMSSGKGKVFQYLVGLIGVTGVILLGIAICSWIIYKMWSRFKNPPMLLTLIPPHI
jgi:hypothetical protein